MLGARLNFGPPGGGMMGMPPKKPEDSNPMQRRMMMPTHSQQENSTTTIVPQDDEEEEGAINKIIADRPVLKGKKKAKRKVIKLPDAPTVSTKIPLKKVEEEIKPEEVKVEEENNTVKKSGKLDDLLNGNKYIK